jgi:hypothetical protein
MLMTSISCLVFSLVMVYLKSGTKLRNFEGFGYPLSDQLMVLRMAQAFL